MAGNQLEIYRKQAQGRSDHPPVLFVHGAWHGAWCWQEHFFDYFAENGIDVMALDLRGHGKSPPVKSMRFNRIADYADDVLSVVENMEAKPVVIGHSMGGLVTQHCMKRASGKLAGAGLLATVPWNGVWPATIKVALRHPLIFAEANLRWTLYPIVRKAGRARELFLEADVTQAEADAFAAKLSDESYLGYLDMLGLGLAWRFDPGIPVMVVGAEKDFLFSPASQHATAQAYSGVHHIIDGAPHDLMLASQWQQAADLLVDFVKGLG
ncbi:MAG: alpha/beta hydrolase [Salaquimonas sp.]|jgi:pimeloyl-ACP methyl ester carboxylesterase|nr:alpha/beta hydrolase [Salaquimonas sp.]